MQKLNLGINQKGKAFAKFVVTQNFLFLNSVELLVDLLYLTLLFITKWQFQLSYLQEPQIGTELYYNLEMRTSEAQAGEMTCLRSQSW